MQELSQVSPCCDKSQVVGPRHSLDPGVEKVLDPVGGSRQLLLASNPQPAWPGRAPSGLGASLGPVPGEAEPQAHDKRL